MKHDGISIATMLVLASFVIDRVQAGILFLAAGSEWWMKQFPDPAGAKDEKHRLRFEREQKIIRFTTTGVLVLVVLLVYPDVRILQALGVTGAGVIDPILTWLVLAAGADRLGDFLKSGGSAHESEAAPVKITGSVHLVNDAGAEEVPKPTLRTVAASR